MRAAVCFERRLPRKIRCAKLSGTLDVGAHLWLTFLCAQKGESPAGAKSRHLREAQRF